MSVTIEEINFGDTNRAAYEAKEHAQKMMVPAFIATIASTINAFAAMLMGVTLSIDSQYTWFSIGATIVAAVLVVIYLRRVLEYTRLRRIVDNHIAKTTNDKST